VRGVHSGSPVYSTGVKTKVAAATVAIALMAPGYASGSGSAVSSAVQQAGRDYYLQACASCHGTDARGAGPVAASLAVKPPDLTTMAKRRKGKFPYDELASYIDGRKDIAAHGSREMPVWGERFAEEYPQEPLQNRIIHGKVLMLLVYLDSIQR
jgi:mono/diheme cytochrome c family protein